MPDTLDAKTYKIILIGDPGVGKTSLRKRYMGDGFRSNYLMTIGADFGIKRLTIQNKGYIFQIWDLSSQIAFKSIRQIYYKHTNGVILVFDLNSMDSLLNIVNWVKEFRIKTQYQKIPGILVGNKLDLVQENRKIIDKEILHKTINAIEETLNYDIPYIETSALDGKNVQLMFKMLIESTLAGMGELNLIA